MTISTEDTHDVLEQHIEFLAALTSFAEELATLFFLEVKLATASLKFIIIYTILLLLAGFSFWLLTLSTVLWVSHLWLGGWLFPLLITAGVNLLFIGLIGWRIMHYRKNLNFSYTRKYLFH